MLPHGSPAQLELGLVSHLAMQKGGHYLKPAIKKGMCTKHNLKHPCPALVQYFPGKDSECISVFKFTLLQPRFAGAGRDQPEPLPRALVPGGNAVPWAQAVLSSHPTQCGAHI